MPMYDTSSLVAAGLPLTNKMLKYGNSIDQYGNPILPNVLKLNLDYSSMFAIMEQQNKTETLERYIWINVPFGLTQDIIERVLFYRGKGVFYFNDKVEKFQFLPFALNGQIDEYGRYLRCNTLPFTGTDETRKDNKGKLRNAIYENLEIVYDLPYNQEMLKQISEKRTVGIILNDSSLGVSQQPIIRSNYVEPILRMMATLMQIINTAMFGAADHSLIQVQNESELASINQQLEAINQNIVRGHRWTPIVGAMPITPIKSATTADLEGLFNTFNSLSNLLKSVTGIANAGVFDKKAHLLQEEQELNGSNSDDVYYNGLRQRQEFCLLVQAYYGYPVWVESKRGTENVPEEGAQQSPEEETNANNGGQENGRTDVSN